VVYKRQSICPVCAEKTDSQWNTKMANRSLDVLGKSSKREKENRWKEPIRWEGIPLEKRSLNRKNTGKIGNSQRNVTIGKKGTREKRSTIMLDQYKEKVWHPSG